MIINSLKSQCKQNQIMVNCIQKIHKGQTYFILSTTLLTAILQHMSHGPNNSLPLTEVCDLTQQTNKSNLSHHFAFIRKETKSKDMANFEVDGLAAKEKNFANIENAGTLTNFANSQSSSNKHQCFLLLAHGYHCGQCESGGAPSAIRACAKSAMRETNLFSTGQPRQISESIFKVLPCRTLSSKCMPAHNLCCCTTRAFNSMSNKR